MAPYVAADLAKDRGNLGGTWPAGAIPDVGGTRGSSGRTPTSCGIDSILISLGKASHKMSQGTVPIQLKPAAATPFDWQKILIVLLTAVASFLGGMKTDPTPTPPSPPTPPIIVVDPPAPVPTPIVVPPRPIPPTPIVNPTPITSGVTIVDAKGVALGNSVDAGQMFIVTAGPGITLTPVPSSAVDADLVEIADNKIVGSLRNGCKLQIVVSGAAKPTIFAIQCNQAPQPPPTPIVVPPQPPVPNVIPTPPQPIVNHGPVTIGIIEDSLNRTATTVMMLENKAMWNKLRSSGHTVRIWHGGTNPSAESEAQSNIAVLVQRGITMPAIVVRDKTGNVLDAFKLPTSVAEASSKFGPLTGVAL